MSALGHLSIRTKVLILMTIVPVVFLATYLILAIRVFEDDKLAYVFESTSSMGQASAAQVNSELTSIEALALPVLKDYAANRTFTEISQSILSSDGRIHWVAVYDITETPTPLAIVERLVGQSALDLKAIPNLGNLFEKLRTSDSLTQFGSSGGLADTVLLARKVKSPTGYYAFFILSDAEKLFRSFEASLSVQLFVVSDSGQIVLGSSEYRGQSISANWPEVLSLIRDPKISAITKEVRDQKNNVFLASLFPLQDKSFKIVSLVEKSKALEAVGILIAKSLIFFILLILIAIIVSVLSSRQITRDLEILNEASQRVAQGDFGYKAEIRSRDEVGNLALNFNLMSDEILRLLGETKQKARMESELKTAKTVQETLFPPSHYATDVFEIAGTYEPASECGGDWWHYCTLPNGKICLWIGDATGHGAAAALITSAAKSAASIIESMNLSPSEVLRYLNRSIYDVSKGRVMMTFFVSEFDPKTGMLTYANASHEPPYLLKHTDQELKKKSMVILHDVVNNRLGQARDTTYSEAMVQLEKGDRVVFYTDGLPEIQNLQDEPWGEREFLKSILKRNTGFRPVAVVVDEIKAEYSNFRQNADLVDDITFFIFDYKSENSPLSEA